MVEVEVASGQVNMHVLLCIAENSKIFDKNDIFIVHAQMYMWERKYSSAKLPVKRDQLLQVYPLLHVILSIFFQKIFCQLSCSRWRFEEES